MSACHSRQRNFLANLKQMETVYAMRLYTCLLYTSFRQAARSFPHDIIEAARLEGLSEIKIFFTMFIPVMKSTYGAAMTVTFMNAWNNYLWPTIILQDKNEVTMPMLVANLKSGYSVDYGMLMLGVPVSYTHLIRTDQH